VWHDEVLYKSTFTLLYGSVSIKFRVRINDQIRVSKGAHHPPQFTRSASAYAHLCYTRGPVTVHTDLFHTLYCFCNVACFNS